MAKKIYTDVKKTAHGRPRRGWGDSVGGFRIGGWLFRIQ
jgi:hypothetical protein